MPDFKKYFSIPADPETLFAALTFQPTIELWTGSPAVFKLEKEAEFSMWDGNIVGQLLDFEQDRMLTQEWFFGETDHPSIVTLKLHPDKKGTSLEIRHTNIPEEAYEDIVGGWEEMYIKSLQDFYRE